MPGISAGRPTSAFRPGFGVPAPTPTPTPTPTPQQPPYTPTQTPSPTITGSAPGAQQYPAAPGSFNNNPGGQTPTGTKYDIDPTGKMTPFTPYQSGPGQTSWRPGESTDLFDLNMQRMMALMKQFGMTGGPQPTQGREQPGPAPGRETPSTMADRQAAENAAFGRAKDRIGKIGGAAMMALKDRSTAGGRAGSGLEAKEQREVIRDTAGQLGEVARDQAINQLTRADTIDDRNLGAGLTQRGQDIGMRAGDYSGAITQRGQDYNALLNPYQNPLLSMIPGMIGSFMPRMY